MRDKWCRKGRMGIAALAAAVILGLAGCTSPAVQEEPAAVSSDIIIEENPSFEISEGSSVPEQETEKVTESGNQIGAELPEGGQYYSKGDVSLYLYTYHHLPDNYITKEEARELGWDGGPVEPYAPGKVIGGDYFGNYEGTLPEDTTYHECDIDTKGKSRGAKRLVWSEDWDIYYTEDHYETFELLYPGKD